MSNNKTIDGLTAEEAKYEFTMKGSYGDPVQYSISGNQGVIIMALCLIMDDDMDMYHTFKRAVEAWEERRGGNKDS